MLGNDNLLPRPHDPFTGGPAAVHLRLAPITLCSRRPALGNPSPLCPSTLLRPAAHPHPPCARPRPARLPRPVRGLGPAQPQEKARQGFDAVVFLPRELGGEVVGAGVCAWGRKGGGTYWDEARSRAATVTLEGIPTCRLHRWWSHPGTRHRRFAEPTCRARASRPQSVGAATWRLGSRILTWAAPAARFPQVPGLVPGTRGEKGPGLS